MRFIKRQEAFNGSRRNTGHSASRTYLGYCYPAKAQEILSDYHQSKRSIKWAKSMVVSDRANGARPSIKARARRGLMPKRWISASKGQRSERKASADVAAIPAPGANCNVAGSVTAGRLGELGLMSHNKSSDDQIAIIPALCWQNVEHAGGRLQAYPSVRLENTLPTMG